jgi:hypothetical protein
MDEFRSVDGVRPGAVTTEVNLLLETPSQNHWERVGALG